MPKRVDEALARLSDEYSGIENFHAERETMSQEANKAWGADVLGIGRVLRAHLYVEYYLNKYLKEKYRFTASKITPLSFFDKVEVIRKKNDEIKPLISSIKRLNQIRNNMSHNLESHISENDSNYFKTREPFASSYYFIAKSQINENAPIDVYELYSQFIVHRIYEILNPRQELLDNVMKALSKDAADIYFGRA